jgi:hypothetical protein
VCHDADRMKAGHRAWRFLSVVGLLAVSCTADHSVPAPSEAQLPGALLSITAGRQGTSLVRYHLADGAADTVSAPIDPEAVNRGTVTGAGVTGGQLVLSANGAATQLYRASVGEASATPVGPDLPVEARVDPLLAIGAGGALVSDCRTVWVLPFPAARRWSAAGDGCWAALAPDGRTLVSSPDGRRVVERTTVGGAARSVFDVRDLRRSLATTAEPALIGTPAWGAAGLAFMVRAGDQFGLFVRDADGAMTKVLQERYANTFRVPRLAWDPAGRLLAIADDVSPSGAVLRLFDPAAGTLHALMLSPIGFAGIAWAPGGGSIAALTGTGQLIVLDLTGRWLLRRDTDWDRLLGWDGGS